MLEQAFKTICSKTWGVDVPNTPPPYVDGTKFNIDIKGANVLTDWQLRITDPQGNQDVPNLQFLKHVVELGGMVYVSLIFGKDLSDLHCMTMSFDCQHSATERWAIYFESTEVELLLDCLKASDTVSENVKLLGAHGRGSGRPD